MKAIAALAGSSLITLVHGHGYLTIPVSRTRQGAEVRLLTLISFGVLMKLIPCFNIYSLERIARNARFSSR